MSFSSIITFVSNAFSSALPVPGFLAKLTTLQGLIGFAGWTSALVAVIIGYRVPLVASGKRQINSFPSGQPHAGSDWYQRLQRAHANCLETLPLLAVGVLADQLTIKSPAVTTLVQKALIARVGQTIAHVSSSGNGAVYVRATFYTAQLTFILQIFSLVWASQSA